MPVPALPVAYGRLLSARNLLLLLFPPSPYTVAFVALRYHYGICTRPVPGDQALAGGVWCGRPWQRWHMRRAAHGTTGNAHLTTETAHLTTEARMPAKRLQG